MLSTSCFAAITGRPVLEVFIDAESAVTIELCTEISRDLSGAIDAARMLAGAYRLEVSSPGHRQAAPASRGSTRSMSGARSR